MPELRKVCILGAGAVPVDRWHLKGEIGELELLDRAVTDSLAMAGLTREDIGMLSFTTPGSGTQQRLWSSYAAARLGFRKVGKVVESGTGGWIGGLAFDAAALEIATGRSRAALALGSWFETGIDTATAMDASIRATGDVAFQTPSGATPLSWYAMDATRWLAQTSGTREDLAAIAVKNRRHASLNPLAQYRQSLTVSEVLTADPVVAPMGLYDVSPRSDGAACMVLVDEATARASGQPYAELAASAFAHDGAFQTSGRSEPTFPYLSLAKAAERALADAGIGIDGIALFELYAPMTIVEAISVETLGLAPAGQGGRLAADGVFSLGGRHPVNVSGGLTSRGHPTGVTALYDLFEIFLQLTCRAGERQVCDAEYALQACETGKYNGAMVSILRRGGS